MVMTPPDTARSLFATEVKREKEEQRERRKLEDRLNLVTIELLISVWRRNVMETSGPDASLKSKKRPSWLKPQ